MFADFGVGFVDFERKGIFQRRFFGRMSNLVFGASEEPKEKKNFTFVPEHIKKEQSRAAAACVFG